MAKILKISGRTLGILLEWLLVFLIVFAFIIRTSPVQTYLASVATDYLSEELDAELKIDRVNILFFNRVALDGVLIRDQLGDTLIYAETIYSRINEIDLKKQQFKVRSLEFDNAFIHIQRRVKEGFNHHFLTDYFQSEKTTDHKKAIFDITSLRLNNSRVRFDDHRYELAKRGMDYNHLNLKNINIDVRDMNVDGEIITGRIKNISAKEKCGFKLLDFDAIAEVSPKGVKLKNLNFHTESSNVLASRLNMLSNDYDDFYQFEDSVTFDSKINTSKIALNDIAYFSPVLTGMNEIITLKSNVNKKVKDLQLSNFELKIQNKTRIKGTVNLPDFRNLRYSSLMERINYMYIDLNELKRVKLPEDSDVDYIELNERIERLGFIEAKGVRVDGLVAQFVIASNQINTRLGSARMNNGILFYENPENDSYLFERSGSSEYDVKVESFNLGKFLADPDLGVIDGQLFVTGEAFSPSKIILSNIKGDVNKFEYLGYPYQGIKIDSGVFIDQKFTGKIDVKDDNLDLIYDGFIDFKGKQEMKFSLDLSKAHLDNIHISKKNANVESYFTFDIVGKKSDEIEGVITAKNFVYTVDGKEIEIPEFELKIIRGNENDIIKVTSNIADFELVGKIDFNRVAEHFNYQISRIFPAFYKNEKEKPKSTGKDHFTYNLNIKDANDFFAIFTPDVEISEGTTVSGRYDGAVNVLTTNLSSDTITYKGMMLKNIHLTQLMDSNSITTTLDMQKFIYNDSLQFDNLVFKASGGNNELNTQLEWGQNTPDQSYLTWKTIVEDKDHFDFLLDPSYFTIKSRRWDIENMSKVSIHKDTISVRDFKLRRDEQFIAINGEISNQDRHKLNFEINDFNISEISEFVTKDIKLEGKLNGWGYISNPFNNFQYLGDANLMEFKVNGKDVGDVFVQSNWDPDRSSIGVNGDLMFRGVQTFDFHGNYFTDRKEDNLDFFLNFDYTDIEFANAFVDPDVLADIRGLINGELTVRGSAESPELEGEVEFVGGSAYVDVVGVHFGIEGPIEVDKDGFYMNSIPVFDEDGNAGSLVGSVYHTNFSDFNFDLQFDLETDAVNKIPNKPWIILPLDRFLVMSSKYDPNMPYYGTAYATGYVNIFGYTDNLEVTIDLETEKGTIINIPMYGMAEIEDEEEYITFTKTGAEDSILIPKFDFTGVTLDLHFDVTPDAQMKVIFDEITGDEITAVGNGDISINLDNFNQVTMNGIYTVQEGNYNFVVGPLKQKFFIEKGGSITWTGDPFDAQLDMRTYYKTKANISDLAGGQLGSSSAHSEIYSYLNLTGSILKPTISFDIKSPQADEVSQSLLARVASDQTEMNRQFFSLLMVKKFQPIAGTASTDGSGTLDMFTNQINTLLSMLSDDYKMNVSVDNDALLGDSKYEFGVSKGFLNDRLILTGSFGVENQKGEEETVENSFIGDLYLQYLLNESGTFRIDVFNESVDNTVIQNDNPGRFTQGAGITYKEDFNNFQDFKMVQYFLDIFRSKENKKYKEKRKRKQVPVPVNSAAILTDRKKNMV